MTNCCFHGRVLVLFTVLLASCSSFRCSAPFKYGRISVTTSTKSIAVLARTWGNGHGYRSEYELYASKGFGKGGTTGGDSQLARTTPQQAKQVTGSYSKLLSKQSKKFEDMKAAGGQPSNDIYARLKGNEVCWFIGKSIHVPSISDEEALENLAPLLIEYSKSLRPVELAKQNAKDCIEIWVTPGNSEMDVAQNKIGMSQFILPDDIGFRGFYPRDDVGYEPEVYLNNEEGFRTRRHPTTGEPVKKAFEVTTTSPTAFDPNHPDYDPNISVQTAGGQKVVLDAITKATGYKPPTSTEGIPSQE